MRRFATWLVVGGLTAAAALALWLVLAERRPDLVPHPGEYIKLPRGLRRDSEVNKVVYLNREGARLYASNDDASVNGSSLVLGVKKTFADIPPFSGSAARWRAIVRCIRRKFADFDVKIVDKRPVRNDDYIMAMIGGRPRHLSTTKKLHHTTGLAPFSGRPIARAVVLIFADQVRNNTRTICETAGMEIAHAYGLDHGYHCRDLMTYLRRCSRSRGFVDKAVRCGEHKKRDCKNGQPTQNSYRFLLAKLGPSAALRARLDKAAARKKKTTKTRTRAPRRSKRTR